MGETRGAYRLTPALSARYPVWQRSQRRGRRDYQGDGRGDGGGVEPEEGDGEEPGSLPFSCAGLAVARIPVWTQVSGARGLCKKKRRTLHLMPFLQGPPGAAAMPRARSRWSTYSRYADNLRQLQVAVGILRTAGTS